MRHVFLRPFVLATLSALFTPMATNAQTSQPIADDADPRQPALERAARVSDVPTAAPEDRRFAARGGVPFGEALFAGNDVAPTIANVSIDLTTGVATPLFMVDAWGAAYDPVNEILYHNDGSTLYQWPLAGAPVLLGTVMDPTGATVTLHGLAFYGGTLYATSISTDVIYTVDPGTQVATPFITLVDTAVSISGLAADPTDGTLYGTDDLGATALVRINLDGTTTTIAPYLAGETDVDGLAIDSNRRAYLITDDNSPAVYNIFDLDTMTWVGTLPYPWGSDSANQVSGAILITDVPEVTLTKTGALDVGGDGLASPGDIIAYSFLIENSGTVTLTNVSVTDPMVSPITCPSGNPIPTLGAGESETCTGSYAITLADIDAGQKTNTATASGQDPSAATVDDQDTHIEPISQSANLVLDKTADPIAVVPGESAVFSFVVTNLGPATATSVQVVDTLPPELSWISDTCGAGPPAGQVWTWLVGNLAPTGSASCDVTVLVDADASGDVLNLAVASSGIADPDPGSAQASARLTVSLLIPTVGGFGLFVLALLLAVAGVQLRPR